MEAANKLSLFAAPEGHAVSDVSGKCLLQVGRGFESLKPSIASGLQSQLIDTAADRALVSFVVSSGVGAVASAVLVVVLFKLVQWCLASKESKEDQTRPTEGSPAAAAAAGEQEEQEESTAAEHYEELMKLVAKKVVQEVGPKVSKASSLSTVLGGRMMSFQDKARSFVVNEVRGAMATVLKMCDAPVAALLMDWERCSEANFPPVAILVAGVVSPAMLKVMSVHHFVQMVTVALPIMVMCIVSLVIDKSAPCSIPTTSEWLYFQTFLASMLVLGHGALLCKVWLGQRRLQAKVLEVHEQNIKKEESEKDMLEEFVGSTVVLQEALLIESGIRNSSWCTVVGLATIGWVISTIWCFVLVVGWTFVPGQVAFHDTLKAEPNYCGAWVTIMVMNINLLMSILFLIINLLSIGKWVFDGMVDSHSFQDSVIDVARQFDQNSITGLPISELLAKAFLLRGESETIDAQFARVSAGKTDVRKEKDQVENELKAIQRQQADAAANEQAIKAIIETKGGGIGEQISKLSTAHDDYMSWKASGDKAIAEAEEKALAVSQETSKALHELWEKITAAVEAIENSETAMALIAKAQEAEELIQEEAREAIASIQRAQVASEGSSSSAKPLHEAAQQATAEAEELANNAIADAKERKLKKTKKTKPA